MTIQRKLYSGQECLQLYR